MKESDFQKTVIELAELQGWRIYHVAKVKGQLRSETSTGFPDLVLARAPSPTFGTTHTLLFRELKVGKRQLTFAQMVWLNLLEMCGQDACVWRPEDWELIEETLRRKR